jgi:hypothetical protein
VITYPGPRYVSLEPPPPLFAGSSINLDYDNGLPVPGDSEPLVITSVSEKITVSAIGTLPALFNTDDADKNIVKIDSDELNAYRASPDLLSLLPYSTAEGVYGPVLVQAQAMDTSGNVANASIQVYIQPEDASQGKVCSDDMVAMSGVCVPNVLNGSPIPQPLPTLLRDSRKPWIEVLGNGPGHKAVLSPSTGLRVLETVVYVGLSYQDAGAIAVDDPDGDLTSMVSAYGLKAVSTLEPTPHLQPHLIRYNVRDSAGNAAVTKTRRVYVLCPALEHLCQSRNDRDIWHCDSSPDCTLAPTSRPTRATLPLPEIRLLGESRVEVLQGTAYHRCTTTTPLALQCDPGVEVWDSVEGDLTQVVHACQEGYTFWDYGLQACGLNTDVPGEYTLSFSIRDSVTNQTSTVARTVHVLERCKEDEFRCGDGSCSMGALCPGGNNSPEAGTVMPPVLKLLKIPGQSSANVVAIPFGWAYKACGLSSSPLSSTPCEAGVFSWDPYLLFCCLQILHTVVMLNRPTASLGVTARPSSVRHWNDIPAFWLCAPGKCAVM